MFEKFLTLSEKERATVARSVWALFCAVEIDLQERFAEYRNDKSAPTKQRYFETVARAGVLNEILGALQIDTGALMDDFLKWETAFPKALRAMIEQHYPHDGEIPLF